MASSIVTQNLAQEFASAKSGQVPSSRSPLPIRTFRKGAQKYNPKTTSTQWIKQASAANVTTFLPEIRNPLLQPFNFYLPESRTELNKWLLYFYQFHPLFGACIDMHTDLPLSRFGLKGIDDPKVLQFFEEACEYMDLFENLISMMRLYWLFGEVFPYAFWDDDLNSFSAITQLPGEDITVFHHYFMVSPEGEDLRRFELVPDDTIKNFVQSRDSHDLEIMAKMDPEILSAIRTGQKLILDNFAIDMLARAVLPVSAKENCRGVPIGLRVIKDLIYEDKLREAQYSIAEGHITPVKIWKIGSAESFLPDEEYLKQFRELLIEAEHDPMFEIVTHYAVSLDVVGSQGKYAPLDKELTQTSRRVLTGMMSNETLAFGQGATYQNASVALRILMSRYIPIRQKFENWMRFKLYEPIAVANEFIKRTPAELSHGVRVKKSQQELVESGQLQIPEIDWRSKANLLDDANTKNLLMELRRRFEIPLKPLCDTLGVEYSSVGQLLEQEQGTVLDPEMKNLRKSILSSLASKMLPHGFASFWGVLKRFFLRATQEVAEEAAGEETQQEVPEVTKPPITAPGEETVTPEETPVVAPGEEAEAVPGAAPARGASFKRPRIKRVVPKADDQKAIERSEPEEPKEKQVAHRTFGAKRHHTAKSVFAAKKKPLPFLSSRNQLNLFSKNANAPKKSINSKSDSRST